MLTFALGFHWAALQSAAWIGMTVKYAQNSTLGDALEKTFDGKHPCELCKFVEDGKQAEKKSNGQLEIKKLDFFTAAPSFSFYFLPAEKNNFGFLPLASNRGESPPTPPPRFV
jgi:hypothetical protein